MAQTKKTVAITGATGFVGTAVVRALRARGDRVVAVSRDATRARAILGSDADVDVVDGNLEAAGPWQARVAACDAVINLAGQPIAGQRWDSREKQLIHDSRVESTRLLVEGLAAAPAGSRPRVLVSASGADYYPFAYDSAGFDDDLATEADPPGDGFLARVCRDWEAEAVLAEALGVRVVRMRTGVVLGPGGGALARMVTPFKAFAGGPLGSGKQWFSWIHLDDAVAAYLRAVDDDGLRGPINLVAPGRARAGDVARAIGKALGRPSWLPVPAFAIRAAVGELAEYLLHGRLVVPTALEQSGFRFQHPELDAAVRAALA